jgi:predicted ester cyclase
VDRLVADGNNVIARWTARGTHKGTLLGSIPPSGKEVTTTGISIIRVTSGKVAEHWVHWDALGMMEQIGMALPLGQPSRTAAARG